MKLHTAWFPVLGMLPLVAVACGSDDEPATPPPTSQPAVDAGPSRPPAPTPTADAGRDASSPLDSGSAADAADAADAGQLEVEPQLEPVECSVTPCVVDIVAKAGLHTCARLDDGSVACWGANDQNQLGYEGGFGAPSGAFAAKVAGLPAVAEIAVGGSGNTNNGEGSGSIGLNGASCARTAAGAVYCWGGQSKAYAGVTRQNQWTPALMQFPTATRVAMGNDVFCVLDANGQPICSGGNENRDGIVPQTDAGDAPRGIANGGPCVSLIGSARNMFCLQSSGNVVSWGFGRSRYPGEVQGDVEPSLLGRLSSLTVAPPTLVPLLTRVSSLSASFSHACVVSNGDVLCWGRSDQGQLGVGVKTYEGEPYVVTALEGDYVKQVSTGSNVTCSVSALGALYCWGDNRRGQLARTDVLEATRPVEVEGLPFIVQVAVLENSVCALAKSGQVYCWGDNQRGQLARGATNIDTNPTPQPIVWEPAP